MNEQKKKINCANRIYKSTRTFRIYKYFMVVTQVAKKMKKYPERKMAQRRSVQIKEIEEAMEIM